MMQKQIVSLAIAMVLGFAPLASALTLSWDRNTEADMKEYDVYLCSTGPTCIVTPITALRLGTVPQVQVGVIPSFVLPAAIAGMEGKMAVTASDTTGNESVLSVVLPFDSRAPLAPANPRLIP